jgi:hypothetical protein
MPDAESVSVAIGSRDASLAFTPYTEGQEVPLVFGAQGGYMVPFFVRVSGTSIPDERILLLVASHHDDTGDAPVPASNVDCMPFSRDGADSFLSERGMNDLLAFTQEDLVGLTFRYSAEVPVGPEARVLSPVVGLHLAPSE